jgi:transposase
MQKRQISGGNVAGICSEVRWRRAGVWVNALAAAHHAGVQMIDTSIVRVHQHGASVADNKIQSMGTVPGGLTCKIHAVVDTHGLLVRLALTSGEAHDKRLAGKLLSRLKSGSMLLADRGYDAKRGRPLGRAIVRCQHSRPLAPPRLARAHRQYSTEPDHNSGERLKTKPLPQLSVRPNRLLMPAGSGKWGRMWECWLACGLGVYELYSINLPERRIMAPR